jgi:hypothetical protein
MRIRWQHDAINDLIQVRRFIAMDNPSAAARVADRIEFPAPVKEFWSMFPTASPIVWKGTVL